jgi:hypothetical protein
MSWQVLPEFLGSTAYGVLSALVPIVNSELYVVASQVGGFAEEVTAATGFLSACIFIPPLYPLTLAVAGTRMSVIAFGLAVLVGRMLLLLAIAFGVSALVH